MRFLVFIILVAGGSLAEFALADQASPAEAAYSVNSPPLESQEQVACEKIAVYNKVCGTIGLDQDQAEQAKTILKLMPHAASFRECSVQQVRLKECLDKKD